MTWAGSRGRRWRYAGGGIFAVLVVAYFLAPTTRSPSWILLEPHELVPRCLSFEDLQPMPVEDLPTTMPVECEPIGQELQLPDGQTIEVREGSSGSDIGVPGPYRYVAWSSLGIYGVVVCASSEAHDPQPTCWGTSEGIDLFLSAAREFQ
ncbi:hypothetical protein D9V41_06680 [Aeromicrobium phragmitis]|uniref:Uncharacterized protein n=1 Tax=Aeromicrobium phragmitis TaxID=2478914 RepID=A0A3L8PLM4_9ACTN|nr:hypothetical protein [Aeromicrobium phragmitis]RLV56124.1 hypothetical protein D9V41_06680 [Aeromicrobium phragmitis]